MTLNHAEQCTACTAGGDSPGPGQRDLAHGSLARSGEGRDESVANENPQQQRSGRTPEAPTVTPALLPVTRTPLHFPPGRLLYSR
ncbi:hypothetical protein NDU88_006182 [Pleurodeles waltl]|uniref:Uncharacterized protein n=1 Tax=Pleurodeles waltl TaxID=8319 RepID=A0AAV7SP07_PLEWA|nr:hypothetical protein NDU88_006182 [Pleurodeles waltl]